MSELQNGILKCKTGVVLSCENATMIHLQLQHGGQNEGLESCGHANAHKKRGDAYALLRMGAYRHESKRTGRLTSTGRLTNCMLHVLSCLLVDVRMNWPAQWDNYDKVVMVKLGGQFKPRSLITFLQGDAPSHLLYILCKMALHMPRYTN